MLTLWKKSWFDRADRFNDQRGSILQTNHVVVSGSCNLSCWTNPNVNLQSEGNNMLSGQFVKRNPKIHYMISNPSR